MIEEVAGSKISGEEDRYSHTDLSDFQANVEGSKKIVDLFRPLIEAKDKALLEKPMPTSNRLKTFWRNTKPRTVSSCMTN